MPTDIGTGFGSPAVAPRRHRRTEREEQLLNPSGSTDFVMRMASAENWSRSFLQPDVVYALALATTQDRQAARLAARMAHFAANPPLERNYRRPQGQREEDPVYDIINPISGDPFSARDIRRLRARGMSPQDLPRIQTGMQLAGYVHQAIRDGMPVPQGILPRGAGQGGRVPMTYSRLLHAPPRIWESLMNQIDVLPAEEISAPQLVGALTSLVAHGTDPKRFGENLRAIYSWGRGGPISELQMIALADEWSRTKDSVISARQLTMMMSGGTQIERDYNNLTDKLKINGTPYAGWGSTEQGQTYAELDTMRKAYAHAAGMVGNWEQDQELFFKSANDYIQNEYRIDNPLTRAASEVLGALGYAGEKLFGIISPAITATTAEYRSGGLAQLNRDLGWADDDFVLDPHEKDQFISEGFGRAFQIVTQGYGDYRSHPLVAGDLWADELGYEPGTLAHSMASLGSEALIGFWVDPFLWAGQAGRAVQLRRLLSATSDIQEFKGLGIFGLAKAIANPARSAERFRALQSAYVRPSWVAKLGMDASEPMRFDEWIVRASIQNPDVARLLPRGIGLGKAGLDTSYVDRLRAWLLQDQGLTNWKGPIAREITDNAWDAFEVVAGLKPSTELGKEFARLADTGAGATVLETMNSSIRKQLLRLKPRFTKSGEMVATSRRALENAVRDEMIAAGALPGRVSQLVKRAVSKIEASDWEALRNAADDTARRQLATGYAERVTSIVTGSELENIARRTPGLPTQSWADRFGEAAFQQRFVPSIGSGPWGQFSPAEHLRELSLGLRDNPFFQSRLGRWVSAVWERAPRPAANIEEHMAPEMLGAWLRAWGRDPETIASVKSRLTAIRSILNPADRASHYRNFIQSLIRENVEQLGMPLEMVDEITKAVSRRYSYASGMVETFYGWKPEMAPVLDEAGKVIGQEATGGLVRITQPTLETELLNTMLLPDPQIVRQSIRRFMGDTDELRSRVEALFDEKLISTDDPLKLKGEDLDVVMRDIADHQTNWRKFWAGAGSAHDTMRVAADSLRNAWVDAVLLRPGWALKVLPDENFRAFIALHDIFDRIRSINYFAQPGFRIPFSRTAEGGRRTLRGGQRLEMKGSLFRGRQVPIHPEPRWVESQVPVFGPSVEFASSRFQQDLYRGDALMAGVPDVGKAKVRGAIGPLIYTTEGTPAASFYSLDRALPEEPWVYVPFANRRPGESFDTFLQRQQAETGIADLRVARTVPKGMGLGPTEVGIVPSRPADRVVENMDWDRVLKLVKEDGVTPRGAIRIVATEQGYGVKNWNMFTHEVMPDGSVRLWALPVGEGYMPNVSVFRGNSVNPFLVDDFAGDVKRTVTPAQLRKGLDHAVEQRGTQNFGRWPRRETQTWSIQGDALPQPVGEQTWMYGGRARIRKPPIDYTDEQYAQMAWDQHMGAFNPRYRGLHELEDWQVERAPDTGEVIAVHLKYNLDDERLFRTYLSDPKVMRQIKTNRQLYDELTALASGNKAIANEILRGAGYDSISHIGGRASNYPEHRVVGFFSEDQLRPGGVAGDVQTGSRTVGKWVEQPDELWTMPVEGMLPDDPAAIQGMTEDTAFRSMLSSRGKIAKSVAKQHLTATFQHDPKAYFDQWSTVLDHKIVQSPLAMQALRTHLSAIDPETGRVMTRERFIDWIDRNDGVYALRRTGQSTENFADETLSNIEYRVFGNRVDKYGRDEEFGHAILERQTMPEQLKQLTKRWAPERYPEIEFANLDDALRYNTNALNRARHNLYTYLMRQPSSTLNRQPLWKAFFTREVERRLNIAYAQGRKFTDTELQEIFAGEGPIGTTARSYAINRSLSYMFSYMDHSRFAEAHRLLFPFFSAYQEQFSVWTRLLWENPSALARVRYFGHMFNESGMIQTDPDTGELKIGTKPLIFMTLAATLFHPIGLYAGLGAYMAEEGTNFALRHFISPGLKNMPNIDWAVPVNSLNIFLQQPLEMRIGDVSALIPTPGVGPLAAPVVDYLIQHYPSSWPGKSRLLAWAGSNGTGINLLPSSWVRILTSAFDINSQQFQATKQHMLDLMAISSSEHLDPHTADAQAEKMARQFLAFRGLLGMLSASSPQPVLPGQAIRDEYQALLDAGNTLDQAQKIMTERYPNRPDILLPTISYTTWNAFPQATINGKEVEGQGAGPGIPNNKVVSAILQDPQFEQAAQQHPEFAFFLIPSEFRSGDQPFDYQSYAEQLAKGMRTYKPAAYFNEDGEFLGGRLYELQRQQGWAEAHAVLAQYEVQQSLAGPDISTSEERELKAKYLTPYIKQIKEEFPAFAKDWDFTQTERDPFLNRNMDIIRHVIQLPLWKDTRWAESMREYFAWRDPVAAKMLNRNISWDSNAAAGIRDEHEQLVNRLTREFGDDFTIAYNTWLQNDLEFGATRRDIEARQVPQHWITRFQEPWEREWAAAQDLAFGGYSTPEQQKAGFAKMRALALQAYNIEDRAKARWPDVTTSLNPIERHYLELNPTQRKEAALNAAITPYVFLNKYQRQKVLKVKTTDANEDLWMQVERMKLDVYRDIVGMSDEQQHNRWEQFNHDIDNLVAEHPGFKVELHRNHTWGWTLWKVLPQLKPNWYSGKSGKAWTAIEEVTKGMRKVFERADFVDDSEFDKAKRIFTDYVNEWRDYSPDFDRQWSYLQGVSGESLYDFLIPELWWIRV